MDDQALITQLFQTEYRKIVSVLCKLFGLLHLEIAEDITHDTFLLASETWGIKGIPEHPSAWLYFVAKNKTKDYLKRHQNFSDNIAAEFKRNQHATVAPELDLSAQNITDSQLQMIFAICNPLIPAEAQIGLALRVLCGFGIEEIAQAFLTNKETINKRLLRAKEKLRLANVKIELPNEVEIDQRLETVLTTLYLLFNEGYHSRSQQSPLRKEMCLEAMRLTYFLLENAATNQPKVNALMALMCFHASRFDARLDQAGNPILYDQQDKALWDDQLIAKGNFFLIESAKGQALSKYHLEASIAYWHSTKTAHAAKWPSILKMYNQLLQIEYSPMAALNRTFALSKVQGPAKAIQEALKLDLQTNHFYHTLLGYLYAEIDPAKAIAHLEQALQLAKHPSDVAAIEQHLQQWR